jgi:hypothetical protein
MLTMQHPLYPQKLALTSPTSGNRFVGIVRLPTEATELLLLLLLLLFVVVVVVVVLPMKLENSQN